MPSDTNGREFVAIIINLRRRTHHDCRYFYSEGVLKLGYCYDGVMGSYDSSPVPLDKLIELYDVEDNFDIIHTLMKSISTL